MLAPALDSVLAQWVPQKQLLTAQILQGLAQGDFKDLRIQEDLEGALAVVLSGRAQDIFKAAQLPNVDEMMLLEDF